MRCKYSKSCSMFQPESPTCTKDGGNYYGTGRKAGCYRRKGVAMNEKRQ